MKHKITFLVLFIIIFILFFSINRFLFNTNSSILIDKVSLDNSIFNIISETNINLDKSDFNDIKSENYKSVVNKQIIGQGFFINKSGEFFTNKHIINNLSSKYYIIINNKNYDFEIIKEYKNKDLILGKINNFENKYFLKLNNNNNNNNNISLASGYIDIENSVFIYKKNELINGEIIGINKKIEELHLVNLIETNIKLESGDSGSPLFNEGMKVIGINTAIKQYDNISYAQTIN